MEAGVSTDSDPSQNIKVLDRRWFTQEGELREDRPRAQVTETPASQDATAAKKATTKPAEPAPAERPTGAVATSPVFMELVATLAQQTELLLAGAPGLPKQPEQARHLIDFLGVLESKTRGNLSTEESQFLSNVLFQLRALFVQRR